MHAPPRNTGRLIMLAGAFGLSGAWGPVGCTEDPKGPITELRGSWGGPHFGLLVTGSEATAWFDCAAGTLEIPIPVDDEGRFTARGDHTREIGPAAFTNPAHYEGWAFHDALVLTATVRDTLSGGDPFEIGPFVGTPGGDPEVAHCQ